MRAGRQLRLRSLGLTVLVAGLTLAAVGGVALVPGCRVLSQPTALNPRIAPSAANSAPNDERSPPSFVPTARPPSKAGLARFPTHLVKPANPKKLGFGGGLSFNRHTNTPPTISYGMQFDLAPIPNTHHADVWGSTIETTLDLGGIRISNRSWRSIRGEYGPVEDAGDSSAYIYTSHIPVAIESIVFTPLEAPRFHIALRIKIAFEHVGGSSRMPPSTSSSRRTTAAWASAPTRVRRRIPIPVIGGFRARSTSIPYARCSLDMSMWTSMSSLETATASASTRGCSYTSFERRRAVSSAALAAAAAANCDASSFASAVGNSSDSSNRT